MIPEHTRTSRRALVTDFLASLRAMLALTKISLLGKFAYPHDMLNSLLEMFLEALVFTQLWTALYAGRPEYAGVPLSQALAYQVINVIVVRLFADWVIWLAALRIESGDILFDVTRPLYYGHVLLFQFIGQAITMLATALLPMFLLVCLIFRPVLPSSPRVWLLFGLSLGLGFLTSFYIDYIVSLLGFWTVRVSGFVWVKGSIISILGGTYLPLWIYPPVLRRVLNWLPFRGLSYTPVSILVGTLSLDQVPGALALQLAWLIVLAGFSRWFYGAAMRRLAIQGG